MFMISQREGISIYFYADIFDSVTYINTVNKSFLSVLSSTSNSMIPSKGSLFCTVTLPFVSN